MCKKKQLYKSFTPKNYYSPIKYLGRIKFILQKSDTVKFAFRKHFIFCLKILKLFLEIYSDLFNGIF